MEPRARTDDRGMTLVEVLVSLAILFVVFYGLLDTMLVASEFNMRNVLRDEAVAVADNQVTTLRSVPYAALATGVTTMTVTRRIRGLDVPYAVTDNVSAVTDPNVRRVNVQVQWTRKGRTYTHSLATLVRNR